MRSLGNINLLFLVFLAINIYGCKEEASEADKADPMAWGGQIYNDYCRLCHGVDGKLALNGAADLQESGLSYEEAKNIITNGRNTMQPFKGLLSEEEIDAVTKYIISLRD